MHSVPLFRSVWPNKIKHHSNVPVFIAKPPETVRQAVWL
ncbi:conserved hypothetical protein [Neisseria gonorrhoeae DGI2]|uniref:Uncharacterized protein n=1 Tax=Neisseria gonorrhoeae (strain NCCP11945) TaxID=521006 RepID=B4RNE0_NEIG2|nr:Hypothetical protein NGK_1650 [Neisseria gonorrhoeae NCCP11945]EFE04885.1 conserved hypothetical protein [Neisseria gonorrhoeae DGI2]